MSDLKFLGVNYPSNPVQRQANPATDSLLVDKIRPTGGGAALGLKIQPAAAAGAGTDILFDVQNFAGTSQFSVNAQGDIVVAGASTVSGGPSFIAGAITLGGNVTVGNDASDTITLARSWTSNATDLSYVSSMIVDPGGSPTYGADGTVRIVMGSGGNPTVTGTTVDNPPAGSLMLQTNGTAYLKTGAGATAWSVLATGGAVTLDSVINAGSPDNNVNIPAGNPLILNGTGTFTLNALIGSNFTFLKETNHTISVDTSTTTSAAGGNLTLTAGTGAATSGVGGDLILNGGTGNGAAHGGVFVASARTVATQGAALTITQASVAAGIFVGTVDPSAGGGVVASEGSIFLRDAGTAGSLWIKTGAGATAWTQAATGSSSLQTAYEALNTVAVTSAEGSITFSNAADVTDVLTVNRTFAGAGTGVAINMGAGGQAVTGKGLFVSAGASSTGEAIAVSTSGSGAGISSLTSGAGAALVLNSTSTGNILDAQDSGTTVFFIDSNGAISALPTPTQNFLVEAKAAGGSVSITTVASAIYTGSAGDIQLASVASGGGQTAGSVLVGSTGISGATSSGVAIYAGSPVTSPSAGEITIDATANVSIDAATASNFTVSGATEDLTLGARGTTITLNQSGNTSLVGFTATSIIGALNEVKVAATSSSQIVVGGFDTTTNSLVDGDLGYLTTTANRVQKAIATSLAAASVIGANEGTVSSMTVAGTIENQNVESTIVVTAGDRLYLSASQAGTVTNVPPSTAGQVVAFVGIARTANGGAGNDVSMLLMIQPVILL